MKKSISQFTLRLGILTLLLGLFTFVFSLLFPDIHVTTSYPYILVFLFLFSWAAFYITAKSMKKKISRFANTYMIINFLKLVVFSLFILAYAYLNKADAVSFIITFFIYYIFYAVLEMMGLKQLSEIIR
jgi:hypothetical protein